MSFRMEKEKTTSTPYVLIDEEKGYMRFAGRCFNENVAAFFEDIDAWLVKHLETNFGALTFDCEIEYFNSTTTKLLLNMLLKMDECSVGGNKVTVNWKTAEANEIMVECGEDFREEMQNLKFNLIIE